jgi:uncharacterized membrane protein
VSFWPLIGIAVMVAGFGLRANPVLVVAVATVVTGAAAGMAPLRILTVIGEAFLRSRVLLLFVLTLPVVGLLEGRGLREHVPAWVARFRAATAGRILLAYLLLRQATSALGLTNLMGHAQTVRPLIAPMAEAAATRDHPGLSEGMRHRLRALASATDNIGQFFGEDIFLAFGGVLLIQGFLRDQGLTVTPFQVALWSIPTALAALLIHGARLLWMDRRLARDAAPEEEAP